MASYARQAKDESLRKRADRIQARAIRRCGELLKQIEPANGKRTDLEPSDGDDTKLTRKEAARAAGLSERQQVTATRVANVPQEQFEEQVESEKPPTVTTLAKQGTKSKPLVDMEGIAFEYNEQAKKYRDWGASAKTTTKGGLEEKHPMDARFIMHLLCQKL